MSILGTVLGVVGAGASILNSIFGKVDHVLLQELEDGSQIQILGKVVLYSKDTSKIGTFVEPKDFFADPGDLSLVLSGNDTGQYRIYAVNSDTTTDGNVTFSKTSADGSNTISPYTVLRRDPVSPRAVDVTEEVNDNPEANITASPIQLGSAQLHIAINPEVLRSKGTAPLSTLLGNFNVPSVYSNADYPLYTNSSGKVDWAWTTDATGHIDGAVVTNSSTLPVSVNGNVGLDNPLTSSTIGGPVPAGQAATFPLASNDRPLTYVNIATTSSNTSPEFVREMLQPSIDAQEKAGKMIRFKGKPKLVLSQTGLRKLKAKQQQKQGGR